MAFVNEDLSLKRNIPTLALKTTDNFAYSQLVETAKDVIIQELENFISSASPRISDVVTFEKYSIKTTGLDEFETLLTIIREYPDILQKLPLIAITKASGARIVPGISGAFVDHVQLPPRLRSSNFGTYDLSALYANGVVPQLQISTRPDKVNNVTSTLLFPARLFANTAAVTAQELANAVNNQALYASARAISSGGNTFLEVLAGGRLKLTSPENVGGSRTWISTEPETPNRVEVLSGSTAGLLTALGYTIGDNDDDTNALRPPANRYATAANFTIGLDVGADDDNTRTEITDLLQYFFSIFMDDRNYTFYGQHVFEDPAAGLSTERYFQMYYNTWNMTGEADIPRPDGEKDDKIYANRFTLPVTIWDYIDRIIPTTLIPPTFEHGRFNFLPNDQPVNVTGVSIKDVSADTLTGTGILTFTFAGTTLAWQAPTSGSAGAAVDVSPGGVFTLEGGDGSFITINVSASGIPAADQSDSIEFTQAELPEAS